MTRRIILLTCVLLAACSARLGAVVASSTPYTYTQPDGSVITLVQHGDEFCHWTTCNGRTVYLCSDGFYRDEPQTAVTARKAAGVRKALQVQAQRRSNAPQRLPSGSQRYLVVLVEFADLSFTLDNPQTAFSNLLNQKGYSANGGTGSASEYYTDNSMGKFSPQLDVVGPYKVSRNMAYYGGNGTDGDKRPDEAFYEACKLADADVDFSIYDHDKDGYVDDIFFYYAGVNEAEGGGDDTIWPHAFALYNYQCVCDGVRVYNYACSSEYRGSRPGTMCGIGTFCHEFGHTIGLPDFYDTDYEENGSAKTLDNYSLMCSGCYNNSGRTPPYLTSEERMLLGWMDDQTEWTDSGSKTVEAIWTNVAYKTPTLMDGEYYVYETRGGSGWDAYVNQCLLVCHVDKSSRSVHGTKASARWASGYNINIYSDHPCYYAVKKMTNGTKFVAPENNDWDGNATGYDVYDVKRTDNTTTLTLQVDQSVKILGTVKSGSGSAISGATVCILPKSASGSSASRAPGLRVMRSRSFAQVAKTAQHVITTDSKGSYTINLGENASEAYDIIVYCEGYCSQEAEVKVKKGANRQDFTLMAVLAASGTDLAKYEGYAGALGYGGSTCSTLAGVKFTAEELKPYAGYLIKSVSFTFQGSKADKVIAVVDFGKERAATVTVASPTYGGTNVVDMSSLGLTIPSGEYMVFGYGVKNVNTGYPMSCGSASSTGAFMYADYSETKSSWEAYDGEYGITAYMTLCAPASSFTDLGVTTIDIAPGPFAKGETIALKLNIAGVAPESVVWYLDGVKCSSGSVQPDSGAHMIKAVITHHDGSKELIKTRINVK